jgi:hypothetical protein
MVFSSAQGTMFSFPAQRSNLPRDRLQVRLFFETASMSPPIEKPDSNRQIKCEMVTANGNNASNLAV